MERLYNPDLMPEEEIKATFVARQGLIDELITLIEHQPDGAGVQHVVIIAPRGMGKTTVLLMLRFAIHDRGLAERWQAVQFPEERYNIYDLADFWVEVLTHLAADTKDAELLERTDHLKKQYPNNDDLQEAALALIKDWRRKHNKRLVVLVDNFDMILEQINDERDNASLRSALMNDGTIMLIGAAPTFFHEARAYDQPLYNFFKIYHLPNLAFEQMQDLLRKRAAVDKQGNFEDTLKANRSRLRALEHFTGGNPRLVLMLYRVVTHSDISEVRLALEKLLDEVTPYYKHKVESLPPQQRKILDTIARISSKTNEGLTPTEIAAATRMSANQVSAQLKRLAEYGYVRAANLRGRSSYYMLSEPLYAIWHQMRFGRDARERMLWLINILKALYDAEEIGTQSKMLETRFREHLTAGRLHEARNALEYQRYLAEAMGDSLMRYRAVEGVILGHLELNDLETLKRDVLPTIQLKELSQDIINKLGSAGCLDEKAFAKLEAEQRIYLLIDSIFSALEEERFEQALRVIESLLQKVKTISVIWHMHGLALSGLRRFEEALASFDEAIRLNLELEAAWKRRGFVFSELERHEEAIANYDKALQLNANSSSTWSMRGKAYLNLGGDEEARHSFERALEIDAKNVEALTGYAILCLKLGKYIDAQNYFGEVMQVKEDSPDVWAAHGISYMALFFSQVNEEDFNSARDTWQEAVSSFKKLKDNRWKTFLLGILMDGVLSGNLNSARMQFVSKLSKSPELAEQLFPLSRAIDYVETGDEALLEKLSPEVRVVVKEIVSKLRQTNGAADTPKRKSRAKKPASSTRRTRKQLR